MIYSNTLCFTEKSVYYLNTKMPVKNKFIESGFFYNIYYFYTIGKNLILSFENPGFLHRKTLF